MRVGMRRSFATAPTASAICFPPVSGDPSAIGPETEDALLIGIPIVCCEPGFQLMSQVPQSVFELFERIGCPKDDNAARLGFFAKRVYYERVHGFANASYRPGSRVDPC